LVKNEEKMQEQHYKNGKENGLRTEWSEDGTKIFAGYFEDSV